MYSLGGIVVAIGGGLIPCFRVVDIEDCKLFLQIFQKLYALILQTFLLLLSFMFKQI